jgi:CRISPR-associated exonuclease Cas4
MFGRPVPRGAVYHHSSRRRREVAIDAGLRREVEEAVAAVRALLAQTSLPPPVNDARCDNCSLKASCLPEAVAERDRVAAARRALFVVSEAP